MDPHDNQPQPPGDLDAEAAHIEPYMRLHEHIERLRADHRPLAPDLLPDDQAQAYAMAAFFRAAAPDAATPDPVFVAALRDRLLRDAQNVAPPHAIPPAATPPTRPSHASVTRRGLLSGALGAAAVVGGVAAGAAIEHIIEHQRAPGDADTHPQLIPAGHGAWVAVAPTAEIPIGAVRRFVTDSIVGFVRHTPDGFSALSGVCTHMSCLLAWNAAARGYDCPCHGARYSEHGVWVSPATVSYPPLPPITTKIADGQVWVYIIAPTAPPSATTPAATTPSVAPYTER